MGQTMELISVQQTLGPKKKKVYNKQERQTGRGENQTQKVGRKYIKTFNMNDVIPHRNTYKKERQHK